MHWWYSRHQWTGYECPFPLIRKTWNIYALLFQHQVHQTLQKRGIVESSKNDWYAGHYGLTSAWIIQWWLWHAGPPGQDVCLVKAEFVVAANTILWYWAWAGQCGGTWGTAAHSCHSAHVQKCARGIAALRLYGTASPLAASAVTSLLVHLMNEIMARLGG